MVDQFTQDFVTQRRNYSDGNTRTDKVDRLWYDNGSDTIRIGDPDVPGGKIVAGSKIGYYIDDEDLELARAFRGDENALYVKDVSGTDQSLNREPNYRTSFNEQRYAERTNIWNLSSIYPLSLLNDVVKGTGSVVHEGDLYKLAPGAIHESAQIGRYHPGYQVEAGQGVLIDTTTESARFGYYDDNNGMWWHYDAGSPDLFSVGIRKNGNDIREVNRSQWNIDKLDGTGPSGIDLADGFSGIVFQELFGWYGFLPLSWWVTDYRTGKMPETYPVHISGIFDGTSIANPNLPVRVENEGTSGFVYTAGRQFSVIGKFNPPSRTVSAFNENKVSLGTEWTPIISARRKAGSEFDPYSFAVSSTFSQYDGQGEAALMLVIGGTLTGADFMHEPNNTSESETGVVFDTSATAITGGESASTVIPVTIGWNPGSTESPTEDRGFRFARRVPRGLNITLVGRTIQGQGVDVRGFMNIQEEW